MKKLVAVVAGGFALLVILSWSIDATLRQEVISLARLTLYALTCAIVSILNICCFYLILATRERVLIKQAERKQLQREAEIYTIVSDHGVFVRDTNAKAVWRPLHLNPAARQNGIAAEPSPIEIAAWQTWTLRHRPSAFKDVSPQLLPEPNPTVDLLTALEAVQRCLIVGPSDAGKTTLLQWIISRRQTSSKVIVIDPHAYPHKWQGGKVIGTGRTYKDIDRALTALVQLMTKRYHEIGRGQVAEGQHPRLTVIIDEWRAIVYNVKGASEALKALLTESRKAAFSVFVASHSDRAKPLGLEGEYDLKDGFAIVRLSVVNGQREATIDFGNGEVPANLPGPFATVLSSLIPPTVSSQPSAAPDQEIVLDLEPTPTEARILDLFAQGESISAIAQQVFGSKGGPQNQRVKYILEKFNKV